MEIRHRSFVTPEFIDLLRRYNIALVCADTVDWPRLMDITADFVYCRLHGSEELYVSGYDDVELDLWAERVVAWACGREPAGAERVIASDNPQKRPREVFVYFDNDGKVRAPVDATNLRARVEKLLGPSSAMLREPACAFRTHTSFAIFFRSWMKRFISSCRVSSSGALKMDEGCTVAITDTASGDFTNSPRCCVTRKSPPSKACAAVAPRQTSLRG